VRRLDVSLGIGATASHVPYKSLVELRAAYMPDAARAGSAASARGSRNLPATRQAGSLHPAVAEINPRRRSLGFKDRDSADAYIRAPERPSALRRHRPVKQPIVGHPVHPAWSCGERFEEIGASTKTHPQLLNSTDGALTSVRPLLRPLSCRGPVWEFADRVQITATRSKRRVKNWLSDPVSLTVRHIFLSTLLRLRRLLIAGGFKPPRSELDISPPSPVRPKLCMPSCWRKQRSRASVACVPASAPTVYSTVAVTPQVRTAY